MHIRALFLRVWGSDPEMEPGLLVTGHGSAGQRFWPGRVGSWVSMTGPLFDPVTVSSYCT